MIKINTYLEQLGKNSLVFINEQGIRISLSYSTDNPEVNVFNDYKFIKRYDLKIDVVDKDHPVPPKILALKVLDISLNKFNNVSIVANCKTDFNESYNSIIEAPISWLIDNFKDIDLSSIITIEII